MPRDMTGSGRYPPQPRYHPFSFYSAVRLGDPEMLAKIMQVDPYFLTQDNGSGAPIHFAVTYRQLDMVGCLVCVWGGEGTPGVGEWNMPYCTFTCRQLDMGRQRKGRGGRQAAALQRPTCSPSTALRQAAGARRGGKAGMFGQPPCCVPAPLPVPPPPPAPLPPMHTHTRQQAAQKRGRPPSLLLAFHPAPHLPTRTPLPHQRPPPLPPLAPAPSSCTI